MNALADMS